VNCLPSLTRYYSSTALEEWQKKKVISMRAVLIFNPTSGVSTVTTKAMTPEQTEALILAELRNYGIEPEVYHTTPEDTGQAT
jgi:hypothetical protein